MKKNCVIVSRTHTPMFWTGGTDFSVEYPNAVLLTKAEAIAQVKTLTWHTVTWMSFNAVRDYGLESQEIVYRG